MVHNAETTHIAENILNGPSEGVFKNTRREEGNIKQNRRYMMKAYGYSKSDSIIR